MNKITIERIDIKENTISGKFNIEGSREWKTCFKKPYEFIIEYTEAIESVPVSIAVIPFVSNILPIAWLFNGQIYIDELDSEFYQSIDEFKKGYIDMYPQFKFKGEVFVNRLINNTYENNRSAVLFSGGVDAFQTLLSHMEEKPMLITLWGADVARQNEFGWNSVSRQVKEVSKLYNLNYCFVKTNLKEYINERFLTEYVNSKKYGLNWWHDFHHGIGIISHSAPLSYCIGIGKVYIASSFTINDKGNYTCASDPTIDNYVRFASTKVIHDGYEYTRQMKIHNICQFSHKYKLNIPLRVCWESNDGKNCCNCEKCYRTILAIIAEGEDPTNYGFPLYNEKIRERMLDEIKNKYHANENKNRYGPIQSKLRETYSPSECPEDLKWFYNVKIEHKQNLNFNMMIIHKLKNFIKYILFKLGVRNY